MTFLAPAQRLPAFRSDRSMLASFNRVAKAAARRRLGDEDGARRALGNDTAIPSALLHGASMEHLARIALG